MKAISLKQPWANMIACGEKTIETRTWGTKYRGPLLIVSSKKPKIDDLPTGCIVAIVNLVDVRPMTQADVPAACCELYPRAQAWILEDVMKLPNVPQKGSLGLYKISLPLPPYNPVLTEIHGNVIEEYLRREISFSMYG